MTKKFNQYLGKAGHLAVMSEFLMLGWNVAIPEVDFGDDIFVVQDEEGTLRRVQVKTATANNRKSGFSGQFSVSITNLHNITNILVHFVFITRHNGGWTKPVIIRQDDLLNHVTANKVGSVHKETVTFYFSYPPGKVICSGLDFSPYMEDYTDFPAVIH